MKRRMLCLLIPAVLAFVLPACGPGDQAKEMSPARFQEKIRVYEADMRARLQDLETRLEMLQGSGLNLSDNAKDKWLESSEWFENIHDEFRIKLDAATSQSQATWTAYCDDLNRQWEVLEAAFQQLRRVLGKPGE